MIDQLRELIASLKARPDVIVHKARVGGPMPAAKLEGLPQHLRAFYGACNGCRLSWEFAEKKLHEASLDIPSAGKLKFRPAQEFHIGDLQEANHGRLLAVIDRHQAELETFVDRDSGEILTANHTTKDGLHQVAPNLEEYLKTGLSYGYGWYWVQESEHAEATKVRLRAPIRIPGKLLVHSRVNVTSSMDNSITYHGHGVILKKTPKQFLVHLDYGATNWFKKREIEAVGPTDPYEKRLTKIGAAIKRLDRAKDAHALAKALFRLSSTDPYARSGVCLNICGRYHHLATGAFEICGLLHTQETLPRHEVLLRWGAALVGHIDDDNIAYALEIVLGALVLEAHQAAVSLGAPTWADALNPKIAAGFQELIESYRPKNLRLATNTLARTENVSRTFLGQQEAGSRSYLRFEAGYLVHWP